MKGFYNTADFLIDFLGEICVEHDLGHLKYLKLKFQLINEYIKNEKVSVLADNL